MASLISLDRRCNTSRELILLMFDVHLHLQTPRPLLRFTVGNLSQTAAFSLPPNTSSASHQAPRQATYLLLSQEAAG